MMYSEYVDSLDHAVKARYINKIDIIGGVDPYTIQDLSPDTKYLPKVDEMEIINYLVYQTSFYTKKEFKAYKSLESYNLFLSGWVNILGAKIINDHSVVIAEVKHSQRLREKPLRAWIIADMDGEVSSAHCTCIAGLGETCSHVGALLFAIQFYVEKTQKEQEQPKSVTDVKAYWVVPSGKPGEPSTSKDINYLSAKKMSKIAKGEIEVVTRESVSDESVPESSLEDVTNILQKMKEENLECAAMSVVSPFCLEYGEQYTECDEENTFEKLFKEENSNLDLPTLIEMGKQTDISITEEQCKKIERFTRNQAKSIGWFKFRKGRVTASVFKNVTKTSIQKPSKSLLQQICYPSVTQMRVPAIKHGCQHEKDALQKFEELAAQTHKDLRVLKVGLIIHPAYPQMGASPDALARCACCGVAPVEVKCPFCIKDKSIEEGTFLKNFCLQKKDLQLALKKDHQYYYQCQMQMALLECEFGFFVVWTKKDVFIEKIAFDREFWEANCALVNTFCERVLMPELLGKYFTKKRKSSDTCAPGPSTQNVLYCHCNGPDDGSPMIACDNLSCSIVWFHMRCVNIDSNNIPQSWLCTNCK